MESNGVGLCIKIVQFPSVPELSAKDEKLFSARLLSVSIRLSRNPLSMWVVEWNLVGSPLSDSQSPSKPLYTSLKLENLTDCYRTVLALVGEWRSMANLHSLAREYSRYSTMLDLVRVQSYNYRSIVLQYGPDNIYTATVTWSPPSQAFSLSF